MLAGIGVTLLGVFYLAFLGGFLIAMRVGFENVSGPFYKTFAFLFYRDLCLRCRRVFCR
jgi:hypothetical protein